jgi:hypothetical protein
MVIGFFSWPNLSSRIMALGSTQPLTEMSIRNLPGGKGQLAHKAINLTTICLENVGASTSTTLWAPTACYRDSFTWPFYIASNLCLFFTHICCSTCSDQIWHDGRWPSWGGFRHPKPCMGLNPCQPSSPLFPLSKRHLDCENNGKLRTGYWQKCDHEDILIIATIWEGNLKPIPAAARKQKKTWSIYCC